MKVSFIGNCNTEAIAHAAYSAFLNDPDFSFKFYWRAHATEENHLAEIAASDWIVYQLMDYEVVDGLQDMLASKKGQVIRAPYVAGNFLWPFSVKAHPRNNEAWAPYRPSGPYDAQISDAQLIKMMELHKDQPTYEIVNRFMELDYNKISPLDRYYEFNRLKYTKLGESCGLNLWDTVEKYMLDHRPFWTALHPSSLVLKPMSRFVLEQLGAPAEGIERAMGVFGEPLSFVHMPVHPSVVRHFGIRSINEHETYRYFSEGRFSDRQYFHRFVDFEFDDEVAKAVHELHADGKVKESLATLEKVSRRNPRNPDAYYQAGLAYEKLGRPLDAAQQAIKAMSIEPDRPEFVGLYQRTVRPDQIRLVSAAVLKIDETYHFGDAASPTTAGLRSGWRTPVSWGVEATRGESRLSYGLDGLDTYAGRASSVSVELELRLLVADVAQPFGMEVVAEDKVVARWSFTAEDCAKGDVVRTIEHCPASRLNGDCLLNLKFLITGSKLLPSFELGARDNRFGLSSLTVRRDSGQAQARWLGFKR